MTEYKSSCVYVWPEPCPSCAAKDAELTRLREAIEWAIENVDKYVTVHEEVSEDWEIELRRRAGKEGG